MPVRFERGLQLEATKTLCGLLVFHLSVRGIHVNFLPLPPSLICPLPLLLSSFSFRLIHFSFFLLLLPSLISLSHSHSLAYLSAK